MNLHFPIQGTPSTSSSLQMKIGLRTLMFISHCRHVTTAQSFLVMYFRETWNVMMMTQSVRDTYNWHKGDYDKLNKLNSQVDWDFELGYLNAYQAFCKFSDIVNAHIKDRVPQRISHSRDRPPWRTNPPRGLIIHRHGAWLRYKRARQEQTHGLTPHGVV